jgi:hypothetical protein
MVDRTRLEEAVEWYDELVHQPADDAIDVFVNAARTVVEAPEIETETCKEGHPSCTTLEAFDLEPGRYALVRLVPAEKETE